MTTWVEKEGWCDTNTQINRIVAGLFVCLRLLLFLALLFWESTVYDQTLAIRLQDLLQKSALAKLI